MPPDPLPTSRPPRLRRALAEAELLNAIAKDAAGEHELARILAAALNHLRHVIKFTGGSICLIEGDDFVIRAAAGPFAEVALGQRLPRGSSAVWRVAESQRPFFSADLEADGLTPTTPMRSYLAVPLVWHQRSTGVLEVDSTERHAFSDADLMLVSRVALALSGPIELARRRTAELQAIADAEAGRRRFAFLAQASAILAESLDDRDALRQIAELIVPQLAEWCIIYVLDDRERIERVVTRHATPEGQELLDRMHARYPISGQRPHPILELLRSGRPLLMPETTDVELQMQAEDEEHLAMLHALAPVTGVAAPVRARGRVFGALALVSADPRRRYDSSDLALVEDLARRIALALDNARLYRETQTALAGAREALAIRDEFLSLASHELRTPLTALKGGLQIARRRLGRGVSPATMGDLVQQAEAQVDRLTRLVIELLDVSRITAGRLTIEREPTDLGPLVRHTVKLARAVKPPRRIELRLPQRLPPVEADPARLQQVLLNLIENARKYSPAETAIRVRVGADDGSLAIAVEDDGIGIPVEEQQLIFGRFHRAGNVDPRKVSGLGLGLHIAAEIVRAHEGALEVESRPDHGSTFTVRLPLLSQP